MQTAILETLSSQKENENKTNKTQATNDLYTQNKYPTRHSIKKASYNNYHYHKQ